MIIKEESKLLEQESILDRIIADIGRAMSEEVLDDNRQRISDVGIGLEIALRIIDKYKTDSEWYIKILHLKIWLTYRPLNGENKNK